MEDIDFFKIWLSFSTLSVRLIKFSFAMLWLCCKSFCSVNWSRLSRFCISICGLLHFINGFLFFDFEIFNGIFLLCTGSEEQVCAGLGQLNSASFAFLHTGSTNSVSDSESEDKGKKDSVFL